MNETWWVNHTQLDMEQKAILTATADKNLLIMGPPGSGKTNILMLRANYVRQVGPRQMFLTFTRALTEHLRSGPNVGRADQIQRDEISTFIGWARDLIKQNGGTPPEETRNFPQDREATADALASILEQCRVGELYDVIFVDEVQDFLEKELQIIRRLTNRMNFAGDSRQRIWEHRQGISTASALADEAMVLKRHYRIGERICEYADQILPPKQGEPPLVEGCNYPEQIRPSSVEAIRCADDSATVQCCIEKIKEQIRYITDEPIGVIADNHSILDEFMRFATSDPQLSGITIRQKSNEYKAYAETSQVRVMTIHSAKGSEFRAAHILSSEAFKRYNRELAFTAVTRAKTEVSVYHCAPLSGHMVPPSGKLPTDLATIF